MIIVVNTFFVANAQYDNHQYNSYYNQHYRQPGKSKIQLQNLNFLKSIQMEFWNLIEYGWLNFLKVL